ncbi:MAG: hypothetical protein FJZ01_21225 [Candidatus Sericytochromatia bacterium]|nr:hypothetical protein [Candidatus Tanganyikabacteria bacterium]
MVVRVNTDLTGLLAQQQAHAAGVQKQASAPEDTKKQSSSSKASDTAEIRAAVASENRAASRTEPLDGEQAAAMAAILRSQIQANPNAAFGSHDISAARAQELLS